MFSVLRCYVFSADSHADRQAGAFSQTECGFPCLAIFDNLRIGLRGRGVLEREDAAEAVKFRLQARSHGPADMLP